MDKIKKITWPELCVFLTRMTEDEIAKHLHDEVTIHKRAVIAKRLHQRYTMVRAAREREDIMKQIEEA